MTLSPRRRLHLGHPYNLTVIGTGTAGVADAADVPLDGRGDGRPGSNYATTVGRRTAVLSPG